MMAATDRLSTYRTELMDAIEGFRAKRHSAQSGLVREHIAVSRPLVAGPLCLAIADGLGVSREGRREAGLVTGFVELTAQVLQTLVSQPDSNPVATANGFPLALNSADALYSLAHLSLLDLASCLEGGESRALLRADALSLNVWSDSSRDNGKTQPDDALGRLAGEVAGLAAGVDDLTVATLADYGAKAIAALNNGSSPAGADAASQVLDTSRIPPSARARLSAILR